MRIILLTILILSSAVASGQIGEWTFMKGDSMGSTLGVYGLKGVPSVFNKPPATYEPAGWTDLQGNFWLYGGLSYGGHYNAMWKFDPLTNMWTWIHGTTTHNHPPVFGTKGVSSPLNTPGSLQYGTCTFTDTSGDLWTIFGYSFINVHWNTLWKYDIGLNEWTWVSGDTVPNSSGQYGVQGVPSVNNFPSSRYESTTGWVDDQNNFWMFGGISPTGLLNDLWRYNPSTNEWTWMHGSAAINIPAIHGTRGVPSSLNTPGGRYCYTHWKDLSGNLWFFGGEEILDQYADLWKYDISTNEFTWMSGSDVIGALGNPGPYCISDSSFYPRARTENKACWTDACGKFWMMGGTDGFYMNDLWYYDPVTNEWTILSGNAAIPDSGNYGTMGVSSPLNHPPSRNGSVSWLDLNGNFWMFGGYALRQPSNYIGDLWRYVPDTACGGCTLEFLTADFVSDSLICPGSCIDFTNLSDYASSYQWIFTGASIASSTDVNPQNVCYNMPGYYDVTLIATNANGSDTMTLTNYIIVFPFPPAQGIVQSGDTLFANQGSASYQWYFNNSIIAGATNYFYVATQSGDYNVVCTDLHNCEVEAAIFNVIAKTDTEKKQNYFEVYPNPATGELMIGTENIKIETVTIISLTGDVVLETQEAAAVLDISALAEGFYFIEAKTKQGIYRSSFVKNSD